MHSPASHLSAQGASGEALAGPTVGVIYNPRSHRNRGQDFDIADRPNVHFAQPLRREDIATELEEFARAGIDYLIINGGDGTVRDVLTCGMRVFGDRWPALAVLPKGKTNALNVDLGAPSGWNLTDAVDAFASGNRVVRRPVVVTRLDEQETPLVGFILGAGGFTLGIQAGQDAHRLGAFDSLAVGVTAAWGVMQALFGSDANKWRRGAKMDILLGEKREPLAHSGQGFEGRRAVMLASTLETFPMGLKLFGKFREGLKLAVMDRPGRRLLAALPKTLFLGPSEGMEAKGFHQLATDRFELAIEDDFILDGEAFPGGRFVVESGPQLQFVVP
ncbi:diacylglycerol kinase family protein [Erythrobacter sp. HKB08]|uniref:diacylglycerol/lipid kinase family protein n=1 Tax=Erythrobacter sp. HKB08 TaxID=2502843 RepID=UPI0013E8DEA5|nr:diacylglycerol kinase family protein [Erythrobacter sp. HKB08]